MLSLITGSIGSGKTLYAVSKIQEYLTEYDIIYTNIDGLIVDFFWVNHNCKVINFDLWANQNELIDLIFKARNINSDLSQLFIIDEAHFYFFNDKKQIDKEFLKFLSYSRHFGIDFILISQNPAQIHYQVRHLINRHTHIRRKFGTGLQTVLEKEGIIYEIDNPPLLKLACENGEIINKKAYLNRKYFEAYRSSNSLCRAKNSIPYAIKLKAFVYSLPLILTFVFIKFKYFS